MLSDLERLTELRAGRARLHALGIGPQARVITKATDYCVFMVPIDKLQLPLLAWRRSKSATSAGLRVQPRRARASSTPLWLPDGAEKALEHETDR